MPQWPRICLASTAAVAAELVTYSRLSQIDWLGNMRRASTLDDDGKFRKGLRSVDPFDIAAHADTPPFEPAMSLVDVDVFVTDK